MPPRGTARPDLPRSGALLGHIPPAGPDENGDGCQCQCPDKGQAVDDPVHEVSPPDSHGAVGGVDGYQGSGSQPVLLWRQICGLAACERWEAGGDR